MPHFDIPALIETVGYIGLFSIVFAESGLFFGFFLPGDSLLFTAGLVASQGFLNIYVLLIIIPVAAILGDSVGYWFGKKVGPKIFCKDDSLFFHRAHVARAERFYARYGPKALVIARFVPVVRTFVPILAGVGSMHYGTFLKFNIIGALLWGVGVTLLGFLLGNTIPGIDTYLLPIILLIIVCSFVPIGIEWWKDRKHPRKVQEDNVQ